MMTIISKNEKNIEKQSHIFWIVAHKIDDTNRASQGNKGVLNWVYLWFHLPKLADPE